MEYELRIVAFNRPEYLRHVVNALVQVRGLEKYRIVASVDGSITGGYEPDVLKILRGLTRDIRCRSRLGCNAHLRLNWLEASRGNADRIFILEDDLCLARSALEFCENNDALLSQSAKSICPYCAPFIEDRPERTRDGWRWSLAGFIANSWFTPWGVYLSRETASQISGLWPSEWDNAEQTWDQLLHYEVMQVNRFLQINPLVTRVRNIGAFGTHMHGGCRIHTLTSDDVE